MNFNIDLSGIVEAIMKSLEKHGLIPTVLTITGLLIFASLLILSFQLPEIILAIKA